MSSQKALLLTAKGGDFRLGTRPIPSVLDGQLVVRLHTIGLNPADWKIQKSGLFVTEYPAVLGMDGAGVVAEVGNGVEGVKKGDRVLVPGIWKSDYGTFQEYVLIPADITAKIPSNITFEEAAGIPLCLNTAAMALYGAEGPAGAGLLAPWLEGGRGKYADQSLLVLGGGTIVGQFVIQLAKLSGFSPIVITASTHHKPFLNFLGATHVIDRHLPLSSLPSQFTAALGGGGDELYQFDVIYYVLGDSEAHLRKAYDLVKPGGTFISAPFLPESMGGDGKTLVRAFGLAHTDDEGQRESVRGLYKVLTSLLENGEIKPPRVEVIPGGLGGIVDGLGKLERTEVSGTGEVSGQKLVVRVDETV